MHGHAGSAESGEMKRPPHLDDGLSAVLRFLPLVGLEVLWLLIDHALHAGTIAELLRRG